jgi:hypothetical protein
MSRIKTFNGVTDARLRPTHEARVRWDSVALESRCLRNRAVGLRLPLGGRALSVVQSSRHAALAAA